ncbi:MAG: hypothetical protein K0S41_814 [Anaerocolumna sp.]|jgi:hypothetical protein|nr:hypothetical protein [Anaerocolumna sp.]
MKENILNVDKVSKMYSKQTVLDEIEKRDYR